MNYLALAITMLTQTPMTGASELEGPGRFCGYAPIVDLLAGEKVTTLSGGMHVGAFRWQGAFGALEVRGIGWASRPRGRIARQKTAKGHIRFEERREDGRYLVAIWNGRHGAAYFHASRPFTAAQLFAIDRVDLFQEGEEPEGCALRTAFIVE